jgi:hypothetical protein
MADAVMQAALDTDGQSATATEIVVYITSTTLCARSSATFLT